jgi:hypothetical protein
MSSIELGQYVPGLTGRSAFLAHWANTLDFFEKRRAVQRFYSAPGQDAWRRQIAADHRVRYVLWSRYERMLGSWDPTSAEWLSPVWEADGVTVFMVR